MKYIYRGPMPIGDGAGGLIKPGDERDFPSEPDWGPWERADGTPGPAAVTVNLDAVREAVSGPGTAGGHLAVTPPELAAQGILARDPKGM